MSSQIFSLEIFIDRLRLSAGEKCLFPSTILKLLSYEPAQISTIDENIQQNLREFIKLSEKSEKNEKIKQISDLKDSEGNFIIRKGKSLLFESKIVNLLSEFNVFPLYILITDDFYSPNNLIGVVTINLSSLIYKISQKISNKTFCTLSETLAGKFPILNLMGDGIGALSLKIKLIFIGDNIGRHLPQEQEFEIRPNYTKNQSIKTINKSIGDNYAENEENPVSQQDCKIVRNFGCQYNEKKSIRIQVQPILPLNYTDQNKIARIGLSIDPNDPLLEGPPPLIYNSLYDNVESDDESKKSDVDDHRRCSMLEKSIINDNISEELSSSDNKVDLVRKFETVRGKNTFTRSKSADINRNSNEFLKRMSKPKSKQLPPTNGIVPKNIGWIRVEPQFLGRKKSSLEYKLTKTQLKRIELKNPNLFNRFQLKNEKEIGNKTEKISINNNKIFSNGDYAAASYIELPLPKNIRHPLVPPLFNPGTSISVPSFTQSDSSSQRLHHVRDSDCDDKIQRLPPKSPDRQRNNINNNSQSILSYVSNETLDEADNILNLNPVQSNMSPQMTIRSQTLGIDYNQDDESQDDDRRRHYDYNNGSEENSENDFNGSFSSSNGQRSISRGNSYGSQISQTSEWKTSRGSSVSHNYLTQQDSPPQSPDLGTYRPTPKSPVKSRRSLLSSGVLPGGRFNEIGSSRNMKSSESFAASFDESADRRTQHTTSNSMDIVTERDRENTMRSFEQFDGNRSQIRPNSAGDVTSITKVTKFDRSFAPGRQSNIGTNYLTSTVASMQTDDSQILTSGSFY